LERYALCSLRYAILYAGFLTLAFTPAFTLYNKDQAFTIFFFHRVIPFVTLRVSMMRGTCFTTQG